MFVDEAVITVRSGSGGNGCLSFRREKYVPRGGPDGGDGGRGGSVILRAVPDMSTLLDISRRRIYVAKNGMPGRTSNCTGRSAKDLTVSMPVGTVVREMPTEGDPSEGRLLGDLTEAADELIVARGGSGGRGNVSFATPTNQVPRIAEEGKPGEERKLYLELKLLADVGLVGLPNAGKSTFLSAVSAAHPRVADYPFTTLEPHLGICEVGDYQRLVIADLPGLIEGAHTGSGLGIEFLRHLERTKVLLHLVSCESCAVDGVVDNYRLIETELSQYSRPLHEKQRLVAVSKMDLLPTDEHADFLAAISTKLDRPVVGVSGVSGLGVQSLLRRTAELLGAD